MLTLFGGHKGKLHLPLFWIPETPASHTKCTLHTRYRFMTSKIKGEAPTISVLTIILYEITTLLIQVAQKCYAPFRNPQDQENISCFLVQVSKVNRKAIKSQKRIGHFHFVLFWNISIQFIEDYLIENARCRARNFDYQNWFELDWSGLEQD